MLLSPTSELVSSTCELACGLVSTKFGLVPADVVLDSCWFRPCLVWFRPTPSCARSGPLLVQDSCASPSKSSRWGRLRATSVRRDGIEIGRSRPKRSKLGRFRPGRPNLVQPHDTACRVCGASLRATTPHGLKWLMRMGLVGWDGKAVLSPVCAAIRRARAASRHGRTSPGDSQPLVVFHSTRALPSDNVA